MNRANSPKKPHPIFETYDPFATSPRIGVATAAEVPQAIDEVTATGADLIKVRTSTSELFKAISAEARKRNLLLVAHAPPDISLGAAAEAGLSTMEHMGAVTSELGDKTDAERLREFQRMARAGTGITATIITSLIPTERADEIIADHSNQIDPRRRFVSEQALDAWEFLSALKKLGFAGSSDNLQRQLRDLQLAHQAGVTILVGTDTSSLPLIFPGYSVHEEMRYLVERAGLSPLEVLRGATILPARMMRDPHSGRIAAGQRADLLLLDENPLVDISATNKLEAVVANGRFFDRRGLDALREQSAAMAARH